MKNKLTLFIVLIATTFIFAQQYNVKISYVNLNEGKANPVQSFPTDIDENAKVPQKDFVVLIPEVEFQTIEGIGGAFNENGGEALLSLPKEKQQEIVKNLFNEKFAGLSFNRTPIGASDFALDAYSYSMIAEDYSMKHFSINRDKKHLLPYIKAGLNENPTMLIQASPWSPPAWMKYSNAMDKNNADKKASRLKSDPKIYKAYALYLSKYIKAYQEEGVTIDRFCIQNEPDSFAPFPGCSMTIEQMTDLSFNYVMPKFKKENLSTEIWAGTFRTINRGDHYKILTTEGFEKFDGIGFQYANGEFIREVTLLAPNLKIMNTETKCFHGQNSEEQAKSRMEEIANYINAGSTNYCYWNLILNETSTSAWGWKQNSLLIIDRKTNKITYTPDYNALYLTSNSIRPNDKRIAHISKHKVVSVKDKDGVIKVLIQNDELKEKRVKLIIDNEEINVLLPKDALCRLTLNK